MITPEDLKHAKGLPWKEAMSAKAKAMAKLANFLSGSGDLLLDEHPIDTYDRLSARGYKLDLVTGQYLPPAPTIKILPRKTKRR
jgi:hypothetical protein